MRKPKKNLFKSLTFTVIFSLIVILLIFGFLVSIIGYGIFALYARREYTNEGLDVAKTASAFIDLTSIEKYMDDQIIDENYIETNNILQLICNSSDMSIIYVIIVDKDYEHFTSIFNIIHQDYLDTYTPWELGHTQETQNQLYKKLYRQLYTGEIPFASVSREERITKSFIPHITVMLPLTDNEGNVMALMCVQEPTDSINETIGTYLITIAIVTIVLCALMAFISSIFVKKYYIDPITYIKNETVRFAQKNSEPDEHLSNNISHFNEISSLAQSIDKMEMDTLDYIKNLTSITANSERIKTELKIASIIQNGSLPNTFPAFPTRKEFDIYASMNPAKEVGGDFYDFFLVDDDHLALVMADVSGKGVPAALFMMVSKILITENAQRGIKPSEVFEKVNNSICSRNIADMFVTVWLSIYEISSGKVTFANAGHENPIIYRKDGQFELIKMKRNIVIGALEKSKYNDGEFYLNKGDKLFLYTDGLPEATDANDNMFGLENTLKALNEFKQSSCEEIVKGVSKKVDEFVGKAEQFDDLTMLCFSVEDNID